MVFSFDSSLSLDGIMGLVALLIAGWAFYKELISPANIDIFQVENTVHFHSETGDGTKTLKIPFQINNIGDATATVLGVTCGNFRLNSQEEANAYVENSSGDGYFPLAPGDIHTYSLVIRLTSANIANNRSRLSRTKLVAVTCVYRDGRANTKKSSGSIALELKDYI